jgi:hypothetical protein
MVETEKKDKPVKVKMVDARVTEKLGKSSLVEYQDPKKGTLRVIVPSGLVVEGQAPLSDLEVGIPYGIEWEAFIIKQVNPDLLARAFRDEGIFTLDDLAKKRQAALLCLTRLAGLMLSDILEQTKVIGGSK